MAKKVVFNAAAAILILSFSIAAYAYEKPYWTGQDLRAIGESKVDNDRYANPARAKLMARRAATIEARRNLLEEVLELRLNPQTSIGDVAPAPDKADADTSGLIEKSYVVGEVFDELNSCIVTMEIKLSDVYEYLKVQNLLQ